MTVLGFLGLIALVVGLVCTCVAANLWLGHRKTRSQMPRGYLKPWA